MQPLRARKRTHKSPPAKSIDLCEQLRTILRCSPAHNSCIVAHNLPHLSKKKPRSGEIWSIFRLWYWRTISDAIGIELPPVFDALAALPAAGLPGSRGGNASARERAHALATAAVTAEAWLVWPAKAINNHDNDDAIGRLHQRSARQS